MLLHGGSNPTSHTPRHPSLPAVKIVVERVFSEVIEPACPSRQCVHLNSSVAISHTLAHISLPDTSRFNCQAKHRDVTGELCAWQASKHPAERSNSLRAPSSKPQAAMPASPSQVTQKRYSFMSGQAATRLFCTRSQTSSGPSSSPTWTRASGGRTTAAANSPAPSKSPVCTTQPSLTSLMLCLPVSRTRATSVCKSSTVFTYNGTLSSLPLRRWTLTSERCIGGEGPAERPSSAWTTSYRTGSSPYKTMA
mmetsp:Transcript_52734/g.123337  ORF Transcript_52734/g.123337 Transcript_52734/m.123337 type:complete len:251 (+) Transcript_52734:550-1302(+)